MFFFFSFSLLHALQQSTGFSSTAWNITSLLEGVYDMVIRVGCAPASLQIHLRPPHSRLLLSWCWTAVHLLNMHSTLVLLGLTTLVMTSPWLSMKR
jgi:hypothetical protein